MSVAPPRRIIYVHHEKAIGGAPLSLLFLLQKLDRTKFDPIILCLREGPASQLFRKHGFEVRGVLGPDLSHTELVWFRWWQFPRYLLRLIGSISLYFRIVKAFDSIANEAQLRGAQTLVHLNSSTLLSAALAAHSLKLPLVWHIREPLSPGYFGFRRAMLRRLIQKLSNHIIAICHNDADQLGTGIPKNQLSVVYNFVDFKVFDSHLPSLTIRTQLGFSKDDFIILFLGGSSYVKGAYLLLRAIPRILNHIPNSQLWIAGETDLDYQGELKELPSELQKRVHLLGPRMDVPQLLANSNVLIFPSTVPHFARPVIEAAAMAKPVVASDLPGVRELVLPNETGLLVPANDHLLLSEALIKLYKNPQTCKSFGEKGYSLAREKFDAERNASLTFSIYDKLTPCASSSESPR